MPVAVATEQIRTHSEPSLVNGFVVPITSMMERIIPAHANMPVMNSSIGTEGRVCLAKIKYEAPIWTDSTTSKSPLISLDPQFVPASTRNVAPPIARIVKSASTFVNASEKMK